ncbi:MAG TPA: metallophosphoesterase family protein [Chloroflexota bacterium]|nr:metallophosphoesterase family protein [Chloroflexota bacterium]
MRVAVLSDVHGNAGALAAVLDDAGSVDVVVANGDLLAYGPSPAETLEMLRSLPNVVFVSGNNDRYLVERRWEAQPGDRWEAESFANLRWTAERIGAEGLEYLAGWPFQQHLDFGPGTLVVHASPLADNIGMFPWTPDSQLSHMLQDVDESLVVCGHTHLVMDRHPDQHRVISDGSAGFPFDHDVRPSYLILDDSGGRVKVEVRRVSYDVTAGIRELEQRHVPFAQVIAFQMRHGALMPKHETDYLRYAE